MIIVSIKTPVKLRIETPAYMFNVPVISSLKMFLQNIHEYVTKLKPATAI